jgi:hypothetical protein
MAKRKKEAIVKEPTKKKRVRKKKSNKSKKVKETKDIKPVISTGSIPYKKSDYVEVDEEYKQDKEKKKELYRQIEKGELQWAFFSMDVHYYKKIKKND